LASRVVSSGKEKSREEVLAEQRQDRSGRDRNRRMFGALLGTLQRFKQDETKLKAKVCMQYEYDCVMFDDCFRTTVYNEHYVIFRRTNELKSRLSWMKLRRKKEKLSKRRNRN
jgi:pinin